jgi:hypothetical protein
MLDRFVSWAQRSRRASFVKLQRTIREHRAGILAALELGINNGRTEGLNRRVRAITSRAFGFHSANAVAAMIMLCCGPSRYNSRMINDHISDRYSVQETHYSKGLSATISTSVDPTRSRRSSTGA